jgi:hypothetical protein
MKKIAGLVLVMCYCFAATAQTDLKKKIIDSTCACLTETPGIEKKSQAELQAMIGQCLMKKSLQDFMALAEERNIEMTDNEAMRKLGMEVGMELAKSDCKIINTIMLKIAEEKMGSSDKEKVEAIKEETIIKGTVQNVEVKEFVYVTVLSGAKSVQLVWSDLVANGNSYAKDLLSLKNKSVEFLYSSKDVYNTKLKSYVTVKMITEIK